MTQRFVRYSPDVEQTEPDFERTLQTVLDDMKHLAALGDLHRAGRFDRTSDDVRTLTGQEPLSV